MALYTGVGGKARKIKSLYIGVAGKARQVKKAYVGVNGVARLFYSKDSGSLPPSGDLEQLYDSLYGYLRSLEAMDSDIGYVFSGIFYSWNENNIVTYIEEAYLEDGNLVVDAIQTLLNAGILDFFVREDNSFQVGYFDQYLRES